MGQISSGKGTLADYLAKKHEFEYYRYSSILRDVLDLLHLPQSRENMQDISTMLRKKFGDDLLSKVIAEDIKCKSEDKIVLDGARRMSDIKYLKDIQGFYLVYVDADEKKRYDRIVRRSENTDDQSKTFEQFKEDAKSEAESRIVEMKNHADFVINNNSSLEEFHGQIDKLIIKISEGQDKTN